MYLVARNCVLQHHDVAANTVIGCCFELRVHVERDKIILGQGNTLSGRQKTLPLS
jgi:hypothetical protein